MYKKEKSIQIKSSASALYNNLSVLPLSDRKLTYFTVLHSSLVNMVSASTDGLNLSHRQLQAREGSLAQDTSVIMQASWCVLPSRTLLVLTSQKGIQMYEADGSIMVYWHALHTPAEEVVFGRGIAACGCHYICVGISSGSILVFDIPVKGTNISVSEVLDFHCDPITDIASEAPGSVTDAEADVVTADDAGVLCVWRSGEEFKLIHKISPYGVTCSSVKLWKGIIAAGYGSGQIRVYDAGTGTVHVEINAHARWVCALDIAPDTGKVMFTQLLSAAEDSFVRIWRLQRNPESNCIEVEHGHTECVTDVQLCGARFCDPEGSAFAVTGYDLSEIIRYVLV